MIQKYYCTTDAILWIHAKKNQNKLKLHKSTSVCWGKMGIIVLFVNKKIKKSYI